MSLAILARLFYCWRPERGIARKEERFFGPNGGPPFDYAQGRQNDGALLSAALARVLGDCGDGFAVFVWGAGSDGRAILGER